MVQCIVYSLSLSEWIYVISFIHQERELLYPSLILPMPGLWRYVMHIYNISPSLNKCHLKPHLSTFYKTIYDMDNLLCYRHSCAFL